MNRFEQRRKKLHDQLQDNSLTILFSGKAIKRSADSTYPFVVNRNFFYLLNLDEEDLIYMAYKSGADVLEYVFIKDADPAEEKWVGKTISAQRAAQQSGVTNIRSLTQFEDMMNRFITHNLTQTLYVDYERINLKHNACEGERFARELRELFPSLNQINVNSLVNHQRTIKDAEEVQAIQQAIDTTHRALNRVMKQLKVGRFEYEVAADFLHQLNLEKSYAAFDTIVASGADATILHYISNHKAIEADTLILMDCGATYEHYCADVTRTFPVSGTFSDRQRVFYETVLDAQRKVFEAIKPGVSLAQLNDVVKEHYRTACVEANIIDSAANVSEVYYHSVSHSLGLDTHDVGLYEGVTLQEGMIITVEPGLYSAKENIGIRIEDDVLVTRDGMVNLSAAIPKTVEEIEAWMKKSL